MKIPFGTDFILAVIGVGIAFGGFLGYGIVCLINAAPMTPLQMLCLFTGIAAGFLIAAAAVRAFCKWGVE